MSRRYPAAEAAKIEAVESRLESKIDTVESRLDSKISVLENKMNVLDSKIGSGFSALGAQLEMRYFVASYPRLAKSLTFLSALRDWKENAVSYLNSSQLSQ